MIDKNQRLQHRRRASQNLLHSLSQRPTIPDLVERGILMNENEQFNSKISQLLLIINSSQNISSDSKESIYDISSSIKQDYSSMIQRLNGQIFEYKQTLNQFQDDVQSREQRLRQELENKQRVLIHMNGIIEQQKNDQLQIKNKYNQEINKLKQENNKTNNNQKIKQQLQYLQSIIPRTNNNNINATIDNIYNQIGNDDNNEQKNNNNNNNNKEYENEIETQKQEISKLKQQKKEMVRLVNDRMRDLKFIHQQELQKERQIANVLVKNHKKEINALKQRQRRQQFVDEKQDDDNNNNGYNNNNNNNNYQFQQMQQEMEKLKKMYQKSLMENESLRKSKKKLEKIVVKLSSDIVQTVNKK